MSESRSASQRLFNVNVNGDLTVTGNVANTGTLKSTGAVTTSAGIANTGTITSTGLVTLSSGLKTDGAINSNYLAYLVNESLDAGTLANLRNDTLTDQAFTDANIKEAANHADNTISAGNKTAKIAFDGGAAGNITLPSAVKDEVVIIQATADIDGNSTLTINCGADDVFQTGSVLFNDTSDANENKVVITHGETNGTWGKTGSQILCFAIDNATWAIRVGTTIASGNGSVASTAAFAAA